MNTSLDILRQAALASPNATLDLIEYVPTLAEVLSRRSAHDTEPDGRRLWTFADGDGCWGVSMPRDPCPADDEMKNPLARVFHRPEM